MDFSFTSEQQMLRDTLGGYLGEKYTLDHRRADLNNAERTKSKLWSALAQELGILGAGLPEAHGGFGGGSVENLIIMEEFGRNLVTEPYASTVILAGALLARTNHPRAGELIAGIIAGEVVIAFAGYEPKSRYNWTDVQTSARRDGTDYVLAGEKSVVHGGPVATHLLVTARTSGARRDRKGLSLLLIDATQDGVRRNDHSIADGSLASEISLEQVRVPGAALIGSEGAAGELLAPVLDEVSVAICAEAVGVLRRILADTITYAKDRKQFGQPISSFQALQHRMADMFIALEQAVSMTYYATIKLSEPDERAEAAAAARVQVGRAIKFIGESAVQIHGGMGLTEEMAISHFFKRATVLENSFGSTDYHLSRYEKMLLPQAA